MKVSLGTVEISDEQRVQLANVLDGKISKRKATRAEAKDFIWREGVNWEIALGDQLRELTDDGEEADEDDLIGDAPGLDDLL